MKLPLDKIKLVYVLITGLTLFYVLYIFEAFGIQQGLSASGHGFLERTIMFALLNLGFFASTEYLLAPRINLNMKNTFLWCIAQIIVGGALIHLLFNYFWSWQESSIHSFLLLESEYLAVMVIPMSVYHAIRLIGAGKADKPEELKFTSENGKDALSLKPQFLLFIKSDKNYLEIHFETTDGVKTHLIRNRLKAIEEHYQASPYLRRSHRSYLVNPQKIDCMIEQKGKYELHIAEFVVPLSDAFVPAFQG